MHIKQEEYTMEYVKENLIVEYLKTEIIKELPKLSFKEFELLLNLFFS